MKKKFLVSVTLILFAAGSVSAVTVPDSQGLQELKQEYNSQSDQVPGFVGEIVGGERVNFKIETNGSNETIGVAFDGVEISNISAEGFENPTLKVWTDQETITTVIESDQKYSTLQKKLDQNDIRYEATTVGSSIKVMIFETLSSIAELLGLSF